MIQDIAPHKLNNAYDPDRKPKDGDRILHYNEKGVFIRAMHGEDDIFPEIREPEVEDDNFVYLFSIDNVGYFGIRNVYHLELEGFEYVNLRDVRYDKSISKVCAYAAVTGIHLFQWYRDNRFCGRCGTPTIHHGVERALECPRCKNIIYPRIVPAVIVGVINGDSLLVTKYRQGFAHYALVAGFTEIGETLEETVAREVQEETGLKVKNIRYYKSQPWGIVQDLLAGFYCDVDGNDTIHMDRNELGEAKWAKREEIILQPDDSSLTNEMMRMFKEGKSEIV